MNRVRERVVLDGAELETAIDQLAQKIVAQMKSLENLALVGIRTRGEYLAKRLAQKIEKALARPIPVGTLDTTLYRDDFNKRRKLPLGPTRIGFDILGKDIVLVDDVLFTGRTTRAALDHLADLGRASSVGLAVLIDRGHRELPIKADYVGAGIQTEKGEIVKVRLRETDGVDQVVALS